jgi:Zn-dependent peptidase ImmA (M78 family)
MTDLAFLASPISWNQIAAIADDFRKELGLTNIKRFPIMEVLEGVLDQKLDILRIEVEEDSIMGEMEGFTDPAGEFIRFSESVYHQAYAGKPRARWTAAHEAGHFFLHTRAPLKRVSGKAAIEAIKPFECPERQAHQFAAELLIPRHLITGEMSVKDICRDFGVSEEAAIKRLKFIGGLRSQTS